MMTTSAAPQTEARAWSSPEPMNYAVTRRWAHSTFDGWWIRKCSLLHWIYNDFVKQSNNRNWHSPNKFEASFTIRNCWPGCGFPIVSSWIFWNKVCSRRHSTRLLFVIIVRRRGGSTRVCQMDTLRWSALTSTSTPKQTFPSAESRAQGTHAVKPSKTIRRRRHRHVVVDKQSERRDTNLKFKIIEKGEKKTPAAIVTKLTI